MKEKYFTIGKITSPHGIKGEVKVTAFTDDTNNFANYKYVLINNEKYYIESFRVHKNSVLLKLKGVDDMNASQLLRNKEIVIPREFASPLQEGEYYINDLIGIELRNADGLKQGVLKSVFPTGAVDVFEFSLSDGGSLMIPHKKDYIKETDIEEGYIVMDDSMGVYTKEKKN